MTRRSVHDDGRSRGRRWSAALLMATIGVLTLSACGQAELAAGTAGRTSASVAAAGPVSESSAASGATATATAGTAGVPTGAAGTSAVPAEAGGPAAAGSIDACSLLTAAEITAVMGTHGAGTGSHGRCSWENEDTYYSVTVEIGDPGTAVGGVLPAPLPGAKTTPGPDGIRYSSSNVAEFLIGDRACQVQVVTSVTDDKDRPTAVAMIKLIRERARS